MGTEITKKFHLAVSIDLPEQNDSQFKQFPQDF